MSHICYQSTNHRLASEGPEKVSFRQALLQGLAPDQGLYMFDHIPTLNPAQLESYRERPYHELATYVLTLFLKDEIPALRLAQMAEEAYGPNSGWPGGVTIPLETLEPNFHLARLDQGPTASFKDFAAQIMARLMAFVRPAHQPITILVATSGDTGSAVGEAYRGREGVRVFYFVPDQRSKPGAEKTAGIYRG
ncbi:MAG: hypothetical protein HC880_10305 [Bacteroidia bacterium]|nr:hypothetical protein [Bacteroidia bacterium]